MRFLVLRAYLRLIYFDLYLARGKFSCLHERVRGFPLRRTPAPAASAQRICAAVDMASIWYWKEVLCLQRSAATACLLKQFGVPAHMVIGAQQMPFRAHAWVEVGGCVVNDKPYMRETYAVLDQC
jgi:hypothetical protein